MKIGIVVLACCLATAAVAENYSVTAQQLQKLEALATQLDGFAEHLAADVGDPDVVPNEQERTHLKELVRQVRLGLGAAQGVQGWSATVKGTVQPETPTSVTLDGIWTVGQLSLTKNQGEAAASHRTECDAWTSFMRGTFDGFEIFTCGNQTNISPFAGVGYYQYASSGQATLRVPGGVQVKTLDGDTVTGTENLTKDVGVAFKSWRDVCQTWIKSAKASSGNRFLGATCGIPSNVSQYSTVGYYLYSSRGKLYLKN